jgi:hypothetical protein
MHASAPYCQIRGSQDTTVDLRIFLRSPESVRPGADPTFMEHIRVREKWASPRHHVLPVLLEPTDMETVPAY